MSHQGNNRVIDMLVGDIYGGMDYLKVPGIIIYYVYFFVCISNENKVKKIIFSINAFNTGNTISQFMF